MSAKSVQTSPIPPQTAFPQTEAGLAKALQEAAIDHGAFEIPLSICRLSECRATCCHDGVILSKEESQILGEFEDGIIDADGHPPRTKTVQVSGGELADDFPSHFPQTRCVFLDPMHRCRWQLKSVGEGKHPWFYKPTSCWMHPILLSNKNDRPLLTLRSEETDRDRFASFTPCGRCSTGAPPARETLRQELEMLGAISGRDFYGELNAPPGFSSLQNDMTSG